MGSCNSDQSEVIIKDKGNKSDTLEFVKLNLTQIEEDIIRVRKEDVHYRMTRLIFLFNVMNDISPLIKTIEESSDFDYLCIKDLFEEVFDKVNNNDKDKYKKCYNDLKKCINENKAMSESNSNKLNNLNNPNSTPNSTGNAIPSTTPELTPNCKDTPR
jgi:hypothetical protein